MSISRRLIVASVVAVLVVQGLNVPLRVDRERELFAGDLARDLTGLGLGVAVALSNEWGHGGREAARGLFKELDDAETRFDLVLTDVAALPKTGDAHDRARLEAGHHVVTDVHGREKLVTVLCPVRVNGRLVAVVSAEGRLDDQSEYLHESLLRAVVSALATSLGLALVLGVLASMFVRRPVEALVAAAARMGSGDLDSPITATRRDELGTLAHALNRMRLDLRGSLRREEAATRAQLEADMRADVEKRQREELIVQLRHADRLAAIGTLSSTIIHELGAPLQVISGRAQMLEAKKNNPEKVSEYALLFREQAERMMTLTRSLLDYARRSSPSEDASPIGEALRAVLLLVGPSARHAKVDVVIGHGIDELVVLLARTELSQVLTNLATNAIDSMPSGGTLTFSASRQAARVELAVEDTGTGMPDDVKERLFAPFFTTKEAGRGTGLGLTVVDGIVRAASGSIVVDSVLGRGTRFILQLPAPHSADEPRA